jgi:hypothetical protein
VAKSSAAKKRQQAARQSGSGARPVNKRPARGGRPAGLFTWLAVGLVVIVVAALVIIKVAGGGSASAGSSGYSPTDPTTAAQVTGVPASVFNTVGVTSGAVAVTPPVVAKNQPLLTATDANGKTVPEILYIGAEYCPYCAAQRWATIAALGRFGTWTGLGNTTSLSSDVYPNTPTFSFRKAKYSSPYLVFKSVEMFTNYLTNNDYTPLQTPTAQEQALFKKYDAPKFIPGMTAQQAESFPFMTFANQYLVAGASYSPATLSGSTRSDIAAGLSNPSSPVTQAIIASANYQTAVLCKLTKGLPSNVCTSSGVAAAAKAMGSK